MRGNKNISKRGERRTYKRRKKEVRSRTKSRSNAERETKKKYGSRRRRKRGRGGGRGGSPLAASRVRKGRAIYESIRWRRARRARASMERETEVARPIESAWDRGMVRERLAGGLSKPARGRVPEDGSLARRCARARARAVVSVMIQEGRVDERRRRGREAEVQRGRREKGGGCRGMRPWSRYIRAPVSGLCQGICVFMWNTGEPRR